MSQHYPRNTVGVTKYCRTCGKMTIHRVDDKRVGVCTETHVTGMSKKQEMRQRDMDKKKSDAGELFE